MECDFTIYAYTDFYKGEGRAEILLTGYSKEHRNVKLEQRENRLRVRETRYTNNLKIRMKSFVNKSTEAQTDEPHGGNGRVHRETPHRLGQENATLFQS